ncbi:superoxide dismutase family protein [Streptomyces sp. Cmuel-A718b]|uniref:superoxide dismutase family protein n=1 Tax=Streptomyces sp. Cmuel-A718b TaxID=697328 RepID=UPI00081E91E2|nr:superoxide dismutase family protein [Streptomyces sp. Cmuel-A718b]SCF80049.1 superoxide dismutase, Cu-Zn family [Streptomyces sp. Cmuel-A718b]
MTAWMVRTGHGPAHPISGGRPTAGPEGVTRSRGRGTSRVSGALAGAAALLTLAYGAGVGVAAQEPAPAAPVGHGAHDSHGGHGGHGGHGAHGAHGASAADPSRADDVAGAGGSSWMRAAGVFSPPGSFVPSDALTYDTRLVPAGARIEVTEFTDPSGTRVGTRLRGLTPGRAYGMHVHTSPCGPDPAAAGPHYQHRPSATADPVNEVWLDFRTDEDGDGRAEAVQDWNFREGGARSVIIHDRQGGAGERAACFTVPFGPDDRA